MMNSRKPEDSPDILTATYNTTKPVSDAVMDLTIESASGVIGLRVSVILILISAAEKVDGALGKIADSGEEILETLG